MRPRAPTFSAASIAALILAGCAATPPEEDPVQIKLHDLDARVSRIERVVSNQSLLQLANDVESLRNDVRALHNDVDELSHNLDTGRKQQRDLYADLDQRLKGLESRGGSAGGAAPVAGESAGGSAAGSTAAQGSDTAAYQAAFGLLKDSQYDRAIAAFQNFLLSYPNSSLADNAQYWLGEAFYVNKSYPEALAAFQRLADRYPQSRKLPDAMLKIGYCEYELKQWQTAREVLSKVASQYSDTPAGNLARQRLERMAAEKH